MKNKFIFFAFSIITLFSACQTTSNNFETVEPTKVVEPIKTDSVEMKLTEKMRKMIPYNEKQVVSFQLNTNEGLDYLAKATAFSKNYATTVVDGRFKTVSYEVAIAAILPNHDSLKCMMFAVNTYRKRFEILIEDNRAGKWNYFYLDYDGNDDFSLGKNLSENTVELKPTLTINNLDYTNVFEVTNWKNDKLWFSVQKGVLKAELADGRTWQKK